MTTRFFGASPGRDESGNSPASDRFALVVGNDAYAGARLRNAGADAALIAGTLRGLNFSVTLLQDATKPALERAIVEFGLALRRAGRKAVGLFYFAGHGVQEAGQNYLLPIDADIPDTAFLATAAVSAQVLVDELAKAPAAAKVVILDACRNNPIPQATRATRDLRSGLAAIRDVPDGTLIVFSTAADTVAQDGRGANGPYATALATFLTTPNKMLHEVMFDVSRHVIEATDGLQRPALFVQGAMPAVTLVTGHAPSGADKAGPEKTDPEKTDSGDVRPQPHPRAVLAAAVAVTGAAVLGAAALLVDRGAVQRTIPAVDPKPATPSAARLPVPASVRSVADRLGLSDAAAEVIAVRQATAAIRAGKTDALATLRALAEAGQPAAALQMALILTEGRPGVEVDQPEAYRFARTVVEDGQAWAARLAGKVLAGSAEGVRSTVGTALVLLAAEQGNGQARAAVAELRLPAAENPSSLSQALRAFAGGDKGRRLREAAEEEIGAALHVAGRAYLYGEYGFARSPGDGHALLVEAARHGNGEALALLAFASSVGMGTRSDPIEAMAWARLALGDDDNRKQTAALTQTLNMMRMAANRQRIDDLDTILPRAPDEGIPR
jgi:TPR repeat protein